MFFDDSFPTIENKCQFSVVAKSQVQKLNIQKFDVGFKVAERNTNTWLDYEQVAEGMNQGRIVYGSHWRGGKVILGRLLEKDGVLQVVLSCVFVTG